jgi:hypothetical protein
MKNRKYLKRNKKKSTWWLFVDGEEELAPCRWYKRTGEVAGVPCWSFVDAAGLRTQFVSLNLQALNFTQ